MSMTNTSLGNMPAPPGRNPGVAFDPGLISTPGEPNASLGGIPLRLNPKSVTLPYQIKMNQTQTVGGMVIQIYGVSWGDLAVAGELGAGGWQAQKALFDQIKAIATNTAKTQFQQMPPDQVASSGSVRFLFPLLNYDFQVFVKSFTTPDGDGSVVLDNKIISPQYSLTFTIDNDNNGLAKTVADAYISRLAAGIGYSPSIYNGPDATGIDWYMKNYNTAGLNLTQLIAQTYGVSPGEAAAAASVAQNNSSGGTGSVASSGAAVKAADPSMSLTGPSSVTADQLTAWWTSTGKGQPSKLGAPIALVVGWYISEGKAQNIRGDVAFAQACLETGYFTNSDTSINNFAGIAHYDSAPSGSAFSGVQTGVRAQIQLLAKVAGGNSVALAFPDVAPSWGGSVVNTWSGLSANWASDPNYAPSIMGIYAQILTSAGVK